MGEPSRFSGREASGDESLSPAAELEALAETRTRAERELNEKLLNGSKDQHAQNLRLRRRKDSR